MKLHLRPYQTAAVHGVRERLSAGARACLIVSPTGSGKTVIACHIIESAVAKSSRTLFLAHRKELIDQCSNKLNEIGIWNGIIKAGRKPDPLAPVQVGSVQTIIARLAKTDLNYNLVIFDECHHVEADGQRKIVAAIKEQNPNVIILGLTATPYRADGRGLGGTFDSMIEVETIENLTRMGFLVPARVFCGRPVNLSGVKTTAGDYNLKQLGEAVNKPTLVGDIVSTWKKYASDRLTVCFTVNIEHSKSIMQAFQREGVIAEHLDGTTPEEEREAILSRFASSATQVLCNCAVLTEGWDCPAASAEILARPTTSRGLWRQMGGRILRPYPGKVDCLILDHANCTEEHGFLTDPDKVSLHECSVKRSAPERECRECGATYAGRPAYCPQCGMELETSGGRLDKDYNPLGDSAFEMVEVSTMDKANRAVNDYYRDLVIARKRGLAPNWASFRFRKVTGEWPDRFIRASAPVKTRWEIIEGEKPRLVWA